MHSNLIAGLIAASCIWTAPLAATQLKTAAQDNAPKFIKSGTEITGIAVDVMRAIERVDPELKFVGDQQFVPMKRIEAGLSSEATSDGHLDVFIGIGKDPEREKLFVFSKRPLYTVKNVLAVRTTDDVQIGSLEDIKKLPGNNVILANSGYTQAKQLHAIPGLNIDDAARLNENNIEKLAYGRARFYLCADVGLYHTLKTHPDKDKIKVLSGSYGEAINWIGFSRALSKVTADKVEAAFQKVVDTGEFDKIMKKYSK